MEIGTELFRKKSLDKIKSPESLDDYIRVSNPGVWLLLVSVIVLLAGACVWGIFGHMDSTAAAVVRAERGEAVCFVAEEDAAEIAAGMTVRFGDCEAVIGEISAEGSGVSCTLIPSSPVPDGVYEGRVVVKSYTPLSFVLN